MERGKRALEGECVLKVGECVCVYGEREEGEEKRESTLTGNVSCEPFPPMKFLVRSVGVTDGAWCHPTSLDIERGEHGRQRGARFRFRSLFSSRDT